MHNRWSEIELCKDVRSLDLLCHQDEGLDQWHANIEVPYYIGTRIIQKIIWWLIFWFEKRKLRLNFGVHWDFSQQNSIDHAYKPYSFLVL
jgi:hypothetical protein